MLNLQALQNFITKGGTPRKLLEGMVLQNPIMNSLIHLAKSGKPENVETFARNICREQGRDFDKEFMEFKNNFK